VLIDEPQDSDLGGGTAAAPIFKKIMNQTLQYLGVPKKFDNKTTSDVANNGIKAPDLKGLSVQEAKNKLAGLGINYATLGKGTKIVSQFPKAGSVLKTGQHMYLLSEEGDKVNIPNLKGQSLRDAMELLSAIGVEVNIEGEGYVVSQTLNKENGKRRIDLVLEPLIKEDEESGQDEQNDETAQEENAGESSGSSP
jgi:penicillin-binding protein 2B